MDGFPIFKVNINQLIPSANGKDVRLLNLNKILNTITIGGITHYIQYTDSMSDTVVKWNMAKGIVITSNIGIRREAFPEGEQIASTGFVNNAILNSREILMNFDILYGNNALPLLLNYISPSFDKTIDILDTETIGEMNLKFYWYDKTNKLYPLLLHNDDTASVRLAFIEK